MRLVRLWIVARYNRLNLGRRRFKVIVLVIISVLGEPRHIVNKGKAERHEFQQRIIVLIVDLVLEDNRLWHHLC